MNIQHVDLLTKERLSERLSYSMNSWRRWISRLWCAESIVVALAAHAATTIDTTPYWTGGSVAALGGNGVVAYGQTFTVPLDAPVLQSFSVFVAGFGTTLPVEFQGYVAGWNNSPSVFRPSTPVLFTSPVRASTGGNSDWQEVTVNTGNLLLTPGGQYVFFLGTFGLFQGIQYQLKMGFIDSSSPYSGGEFVFDSQGAATATTSPAFTIPWDIVPGTAAGADAAFIATFAPVPEPSAVSLLFAFPVAWWLRRGLHWL
jgi:hypothetical protein